MDKPLGESGKVTISVVEEAGKGTWIRVKIEDAAGAVYGMMTPYQFGMAVTGSSNCGAYVAREAVKP